MTTRSRMILRAHVQRSTSSGVDDSGNPLPPSWATFLAAMPIWIHGSAEREAVTDTTTAVVTNLKALAPLGSGVTEQDRLGGKVGSTTYAAVVDRRGTVIEPGILQIETVLRMRRHLELTLSRVSS